MTDQQGLVSLEDELEIALVAEEEVTLEEAFTAGVGVSIKMPAESIQDLPPPPTTPAEIMRSPFRKAPEYLQRVKINGHFNWLLCARREGNASDGRMAVASKVPSLYKVVTRG